MIASDASCPYSNGDTTKDHFTRKIVKKNVEDDELGVFGAEKYFKGVMDEELLRTSNNDIHHHPNRQHEELFRLSKSKTMSSVRSDSSWNSRKGLLVSNGNNQSKKTSFKWWLANLGCNCNDKDSVKIKESKHVVKGGDLGRKTRSLSSRWAEEDVTSIREDRFTFPVVNPAMTDVNRTKPPEVEQKQEGKKSFTLNEVTPKAEMLQVSRNGGENDIGSDASSDLFELESFSTNENNSFLTRQAIENNGYAPSEVSVDWSVVTVGVSDLSATQDLTVTAKQRTFNDGRVSGILSRCTSLKVVRVSGDEHGMIGGGEKAGDMVSPTRREWCHRLDSTTPIAKIQADNKLIGAGAGFDLNRSQIGVRVTRSVHQIHASNHSYMQLK